MRWAGIEILSVLSMHPVVMKTAKAFGIAIPKTILLRATKVTE